MTAFVSLRTPQRSMFFVLLLCSRKALISRDLTPMEMPSIPIALCSVTTSVVRSGLCNWQDAVSEWATTRMNCAILACLWFIIPSRVRRKSITKLLSEPRKLLFLLVLTMSVLLKSWRQSALVSPLPRSIRFQPRSLRWMFPKPRLWILVSLLRKSGWNVCAH